MALLSQGRNATFVLEDLGPNANDQSQKSNPKDRDAIIKESRSLVTYALDQGGKEWKTIATFSLLPDSVPLLDYSTSFKLTDFELNAIIASSSTADTKKKPRLKDDFDTEDLSEFESTDFGSSLVSPPAANLALKGPEASTAMNEAKKQLEYSIRPSISGRKRSPNHLDEVKDGGPPRKKQQQRKESIHYMIPLPHSHSVPKLIENPPIGNYTGMEHPVHLYLRPKPSLEKYSRMVWCVPVRGTFSKCPDASSAEMEERHLNWTTPIPPNLKSVMSEAPQPDFEHEPEYLDHREKSVSANPEEDIAPTQPTDDAGVSHISASFESVDISSTGKPSSSKPNNSRYKSGRMISPTPEFSPRKQELFKPLDFAPIQRKSTEPYIAAKPRVVNQRVQSSPLLFQSRPGPIRWNADFLYVFWLYLLKIREIQGCGLISLYFIHAEYEDDVDYIKVYHDGRYSLRLRYLLEAFIVEQVSEESLDESRPRKRKSKPLKGKRLVLLDDAGKEVLIA